MENFQSCQVPLLFSRKRENAPPGMLGYQNSISIDGISIQVDVILIRRYNYSWPTIKTFMTSPHRRPKKGKKHLRHSYEIIMLHTREQPSARQARVYGLLARDFMHHYCVPATFPIKSHSVHWNNNKIYWRCMMRIPNKNLILIGAGSTFTDVVSVRFGNLCRELPFNTRKFPENVQQVTARPKRPSMLLENCWKNRKYFPTFGNNENWK